MSAAGAQARAKRALAQIAKSEADLHRAVADLRTSGLSWTQVGEVLGMTRQGAWKRFGGADA